MVFDNEVGNLIERRQTDNNHNLFDFKQKRTQF